MDREVDKALKLIKINLAKNYKLNKLPSNIEILNYLSVKPKEIITKPTRTLSGVAPIAVMTKPHKCPHIKKGIGPCVMCPGGINSFYGNVPQSYTGKEPATMRAIRNKFDPYLQVFNRLEQYVLLNQNFDKTEIIIMGGTFPSLNKRYQEEFVTYIFKALNDFSELFFKKNKFDFIKFKNFFELPGEKSSKTRINNVHKKLLKLKKKSNLIKEQLKNQVKENLEFLKVNYEDSDEPGFNSMFVVKAKKDGIFVNIVAMPENEEALNHRDQMMFDLGVRTHIGKMKKTIDSIDAIFMMSEAWFSEAKDSTDWSKQLRPSQDPNKKEAIISAGLSRDGESYLEMFELKRSFNQDTSKLQIEFANLKGVGEEDMKAESPLLKRFWAGVKMMEEMETEMPKRIKEIFKELTPDEIFEIIIRQIKKAEEMCEEFTNNK